MLDPMRLLDGSVKAAAVVAAIGVTAWAARRRSASLRHALWTLAALVLLVLPAAAALERPWRLAILPAARPAVVARSGNDVADAGAIAMTGAVEVARAVAPALPSITPPSADSPTAKSVAPIPWRSLLVDVWLVVAIVGCARIAFGHLLLARRIRHWRPITDLGWLDLANRARQIVGLCRTIRLVEGPESGPMTWGLRRPVVMLPRDANDWPEQRRRSVLIHELSHARRLDCLWQSLGQIARAVHWFNPLAWLVCARVQAEAETACDDMVLSAGEKPSEYAGHLLAIVRGVRGWNGTAAAGVAMARSSQLRRRVIALLDGGRRREPVTGRFAVRLAVLVIPIVLLVAAMQITRRAAAQTAPVAAQSAAPAATSSAMNRMAIHLVDADSRNPLSGTVYLDREMPGKQTDHVTLRLGADGTADIDYPAAAVRITVESHAAGHAPLVVSWSQPPPDESAPIPSSYTFILQPSVRVGGIVQDDAGHPIAGAEVQIKCTLLASAGDVSIPEMPLVSVRSDNTGHWFSDDIPANPAKLRLRLMHPDFISDTGFASRRVPPLHSLQDQTAVMVMDSGLTLRGDVIGSDGKPVPGVEVKLRESMLGREPRSVRTSVSGLFEFSQVAPGNAQIITVATGDAGDQRTVKVVPGLTVRILLNPGRAVSRVVVGPDGAVIAGASVSAYLPDAPEIKWQGKTDSNGRFTWPNAPMDPLVADIDALGYRQENGLYISGYATVPTAPIVLIRAVTVTGTVVDATTGKPIDAFSILKGERQQTSGNRPTWDEPPVPGTGGRFTYFEDELAIGHFVQVSAPGYEPQTSRTFKDSEMNVSLEFKLEPASDIAGTVIGPDGKPVAGAQLAIMVVGHRVSFTEGRLRESGAAHVFTDAAGRFSLSPQSRPWRIIVVADAGFGDVMDDEFPKSGEIPLLQWGSIHGTLKEGGKPAAGKYVFTELTTSAFRGGSALGPVGFTVQGKTDAAGNFRLDRIPPGTNMVNDTSRMESLGAQRFDPGAMTEVAPGQTVQMTLEEPPTYITTQPAPSPRMSPAPGIVAPVIPIGLGSSVPASPPNSN